MYRNMLLLIASAVLASALSAFAQNQPCLEPAPPAPPVADTVTCKIPTDGGTTGCTCVGSCPTCKAGVIIAATNQECAGAVRLGGRSVVNGNGWNDGGTQ